jgi:alkylation response protein AidB-like acyl-CoA dehydrogenase
MDVDIPAIPARYDEYRGRLRSFIDANLPDLGWKQRAGLRVPEKESDLAALRAWVRRLHDAGYVPARFRDDDPDPFESRILDEELRRTGLPFVLGNPLVVGAIRLFGTDDQRATYIPAMARGEHIWTQLFSEPDYGSDLGSLQTRARLDGDTYVVDGQKVWSTWAEWSDYGYLLARTEPTAGPAGITAFILDMRAPGVSVRPLREMTGTADFGEVFLDGVRVPATAVIGRRGDGWTVAQASLAQERGGVGGNEHGAAVGALVRAARHHRRGGKPAIHDAAVRQEVARYAARSRIHTYLAYRMATKAASGTTDVWDAPLTKVWFSELNLQMAEYAIALQGPAGTLVEGDPGAWEEGSWQDAFLYARAWTIAGGSNEIMRNLIAERGLGLPREPRGDQAR